MKNKFIYFMCYKRENEKKNIFYLIVYAIKVEHILLSNTYPFILLSNTFYLGVQRGK